MWGFAGNTPADRLGCAIRAALRDVGTNTSASNALREAAELLMNELAATVLVNKIIKPASEIAALAPEVFLKAGALGARVAAAVVSATSPLSTEEQCAGNAVCSA